MLSRCLELLSVFIPKRGTVTLHGYPADEGNVVEVARQLIDRYPGRIYWLTDHKERWISDFPDERLKILPKYSPHGVYRYLSSEAVFFTHGLFGDARPSRGQVIVNLWHGDGFKVKKDAEVSKRSLYPAQFTVGCTQLLASKRAADFKMTRESVIAVGNPRMDQFHRPMTESSRIALGIGENANYVVWVPTFRSNHGSGFTQGWSEVGASAPNPNNSMVPIVASLRRAGYLVVIKPHPQDRESRAVPGAIIVDNADLAAANTTLYTLLGQSSGMITDYSSVWTEYLALDKPIGFLIPDQDEYVANRGLYPHDVFEWLPGMRLDETAGMDAFVKELDDPLQGSGPSIRKYASEKLGLIHGAGQTTTNLLDSLDQKGVFSKAGGLSVDGSTHRPPEVLIRVQK